MPKDYKKPRYVSISLSEIHKTWVMVTMVNGMKQSVHTEAKLIND